MYTACILSQYHWDKAFHFPGKFHFLVKTISDSVRLGVVYLNLVLTTASGVMFCEIYLQSATVSHITTILNLFIYFIFNFFFLTDPRLSIPNSRSSLQVFQETSNCYSLRLFFFFDHWSNHLFQSNQRFQAIEFVDRHVPEKLDIGFLFYEHEVLQVEYVIVKYKATRINTCTSVTHA